MELEGSFVILAGLVFVFTYVNGFHDGCNVVATLIASRAMKPKMALAWAAVVELLSPFLILVLGASVYADGTPSDILADRLEVACDLYKSGAARAIIVSGDNRTSHYNESDAMKAYCVELGVPSEDVYVDHAGNTTYESMWRARHVFGAHRIIVATQAYHLYRAMFAADCLGMQAWGVPCDKGAYDNQRAYSIREVLARTKDFYAALLRLPVDTAGEAVSLNDSGDLT